MRQEIRNYQKRKVCYAFMNFGEGGGGIYKPPKKTSAIEEYLKNLNNSSTANIIKDSNFGVTQQGKIYSKSPSDATSGAKNPEQIFKESRKRNETITGIQKGLNTFGVKDFNNVPLKIDGVFGPKTQFAFNSFWENRFPNEPNFLRKINKQGVTRKNPLMKSEVIKDTLPRVNLFSESNRQVEKEEREKINPEDMDYDYSLEGIFDEKGKTPRPNTVQEIVDFMRNGIKTRKKINSTLDTQYPNFAPDNILKLLPANIADQRMNNALAEIRRHRNDIEEAGEQFNIPPEVIASIILKEQYTQSAPDIAMNVTTVLGEKIPQLKSIPKVGSYFGEHSTGLGAIFPKTSNDAWSRWERSQGVQDPNQRIGSKEQLRLATDDAYNIETIGAVLAEKAFLLGYVDSYDEMRELTPEQWGDVIARYNTGNIGGDAWQSYRRKTTEYIPLMREYLDLFDYSI